MSPVTPLSVLAFASAVLAIPHVGHGNVHRRLHSASEYGTGSAAPYPYSAGNSTSTWGTTGVASASSADASPNTATAHTTLFQTIYSTISLAYPSGSAGSGVASGSDETCASDVTVTSTEKVYVTVTAGSATASSSEASAVESSSAIESSSAVESSSAASYGSSSSSEAAPVSTSSLSTSAYSASAYSASAYSASAYSSSSSEAASTSSTVPKYSSVASTSAASTASLYDDAVKDVEGSATSYAATSSSSTTSSSSSSTASSSSGKRGLGYTDESLLTCFDSSSEISWAYNWASDSDGLSGFTYIPTLWGSADEFTASWNSDAKSAISSGSTTLFSFNEPDDSTQANMNASYAAEQYQEWMNPLASDAKLCAPAVTNGGGEMGLTWLDNFVTACGDDCKIDCYNIHWYDSATNIDYFKLHIDQALEIADGKPLYISEIGATGTDDEIITFLETVMPWMDSNDNIGGYAYYYVEDGLLLTGTEPSTYGDTYMSYT